MGFTDKSQSVKYLLRTHEMVFRTYKSDEFTPDDLMTFLTKLAMTKVYTGKDVPGMMPGRAIRTLLLRQTKL
jgi:hypothetical protein